MTPLQAKEILLTYRPWAGEAASAEIAEAMAQCSGDAELAGWFKNHCAVQESIHERFKGIPVPKGLKEKILTARNDPTPLVWFRQPAWLAAAAAVALIAIAAAFWPAARSPKEEISFEAFRSRMVGMALRSYGMDLETNDASQVRAYLTKAQAHFDYVVPKGMTQSPTVGCGLLKWQNRRVTMICFRTGRPLKPGDKSDLLLFVMDRTALRNPPRSGAPEILNLRSYATASWTQQDKIYLLASPGDDADLRPFL